MRKLKELRGITLVALVVTIIILLILVGVTISQLTSNGLFENTKLAQEKHENATQKEDDILKQYENATNNGKISSDRDVDIQQLKNQIKQELMQEMATEVCPTGTIIAVMGNSAPAGYLKCDGTVYNISQYQNLANYFGTQFKDGDNNPKINNFGGDGTTTFAVPDLQGEFLRGTGTNSHTNQGNGKAVGEHQDNGLPNITASLDDMYSQTARGAFSKTNQGWHPAGPGGAGSYNGVLSFDASASNSIYGKSDYVTPTNTSVLYCIKY